MSPAVLTRTLDEELQALVAGESDECPACGDAVARRGDAVVCAACGSRLEGGAESQLQLSLQAG